MATIVPPDINTRRGSLAIQQIDVVCLAYAELSTRALQLARAVIHNGQNMGLIAASTEELANELVKELDPS